MNNSAAYLAGVIQTLHSQWTPHKGQITVGRALFNDGKRRIFCQNGRKWGKTEFLIYCLVRWAILKQGQSCYYFAPFQKQAREIIWLRLIQFVPHEWVKETNKTEGRITLINDSFIKVDGSDNFEAFRGITPDIVAYDEFKDFRPEFHVAMEPNLLPKKAPLIITGTPPDMECQYTDLAEEIRNDAEGFFIEASSYENPHNDPQDLDKIKEKLLARGEVDTWLREYMGKYVRGGKRSIFPMLDPARHVVEYAALKYDLRKDLHKLNWYQGADPGTTTVFGALTAAIHPYTRHVYIFDEVYETEAKNTTTGRIWPVMASKMAEACPFHLPRSNKWFRVYDEAAAWFNMESIDQHGIGWTPTQKAAAEKETGLSLIKDLLLMDMLIISDRCHNLIWEMENYILDRNGRIPKKNDHLIDVLRYILHAAGYSIVEKAEPKEIPKGEGKRAYTMGDDFESDIPYLPDEDY